MKRFNERQICFIEAIESHIQKVGTRIRIVCDELMNRAAIHDESKLSEAEIHRGYEAHWDKIDKKIKWGTPEYEKHCEKFKDIIERHRKGNRHHPEFHDNDIRRMDLIDIMEMFCDWWASGKDLDKSIECNVQKYGIENSILHDILRNTARRYDVYMTSQGDVYHRGDCHELEGSKIIQISLDEAKRLEYDFCDSCKRRKSTSS